MINYYFNIDGNIEDKLYYRILLYLDIIDIKDIII